MDASKNVTDVQSNETCSPGNMLRAERDTNNSSTCNAEDAIDCDRVLLNGEWTILPSVVLSAGIGLMVMTCRHHIAHNTRKQLYPHPPRKPGHNLSAVHSDDVCHCKVVLMDIFFYADIQVQ